MVGQCGQLGGQAPGLVAEQPRSRAGQRGVVEPHLAGAVRSEHGEPGVLRRAHRGLGGRLDGERQVEERADAGPDRLGVVGVDGAAREHHRVRAGRVGAADHGPGIAGVADVGADRHQPRARQRLGERDVDEAAQRDHAGRAHRVGQQLERAVLDPGHADPVGQDRELDVGAGEDLLDAAGLEGGLDGVRAVGKEQPPLGAFRAAAEPAYFLQAGVARLQRRDQAEASARGALTSSGRAALATSTSALNAAMSLTARSARILRSTSTPARPSPWMNRL